MSEQALYWHFIRVDEDGTPRLGYGDNRAVVVGETLRVEGTPIPCRHGLHASKSILNALRYAAYGNEFALCSVMLGGDIVDEDDKSAANERTVIAILTSEETKKLLRDFARWSALQVIHLWAAPDIVRRYLEDGDESLWDEAVAWSAARDAARAGDAAAKAAAEAAASFSASFSAWSAASATASATAVAFDVAIRPYAAELERRGLSAIAGA
jgi:CO/xanthine dehydrogenase Mo-binding subunit